MLLVTSLVLAVSYSGTPNYESEFDPKNFTYCETEDKIICPAGNELTFSTYRKKDRRKRYSAGKSDCKECPHKNPCMAEQFGSVDKPTLRQ